MRRKFISKAALVVREIVFDEIVKNNFPNNFAGSCGVTSTILSRVLKRFDINAKIVIGYYCTQFDSFSHAFVLIDNSYIVDITATQFLDKPLVITTLKDKRYSIRLRGDKSVRYDLQCWIPKQRPLFYIVKEIVNNCIMRIKDEQHNERSKRSK